MQGLKNELTIIMRQAKKEYYNKRLKENSKQCDRK